MITESLAPRTAALLLVAWFVVVRLRAHREAGSARNHHARAFAREGSTAAAVAVRLLVLVCGAGSLLVWLAWPRAAAPWSVEPGPEAMVLGAALGVAGNLLLSAVHRALGRNFSGTLYIREDHRLVREGPYRYLRHPMYTAFLLLFVGLALLSGSVPWAVLALGGLALVVGYRLPLEEDQLVETFGEAYREYRSGTGALLPRLEVVLGALHRRPLG